MMIQVVIGTTLNRDTYVEDSSQTLREVLEKHGVDYSRGSMHFDGAPLNPGDLDKTFDDFGVKSKCFLLNVVKADNA